MRIAIVITWFALLIMIFFGIRGLSAQEVFEIKGNQFHQKIFGFELEMPQNWQVEDNGEISPTGNYLIIFGPDTSDNARLYLSFSPVKGLSLDEFASESVREVAQDQEIVFEETRIGNLDCLVGRLPMSSVPGEKYPDLTTVFFQFNDNFLEVLFFSYDKVQRDEALDTLKTMKFDLKLKELSFMAVKNYSNYGSVNSEGLSSTAPITNTENMLFGDASVCDGSENVIYDDFEYASRFPAGAHEDEYGFRLQYCINGRYHVDNRAKTVDVYIPDMQIDSRNFKASVVMRFEGGHPMKGNGLVFRGGDTGFYLFDLTPDGFYTLFNYSKGFKELEERTFTPMAKPFDDNKIAISAIDNEIEIFLNDKLLKSLKVTDEHEKGFVGLYVSAGSWVSFDDYLLEVDNSS
jgi:hypothetical protein